MFGQVFTAFISWVVSSFQVLRALILDETHNITFFDFLLWGIFATITVRIINFMKQVSEVKDISSNEIKKEKRYHK